MNVVATKTTMVTTKSEEKDKNIVATQQRMLRHNNEQSRRFLSRKEVFCYNRKWKISGRSQGKFVATRDSIFQEKVQLATRSKEDFVMT